MSAKLVGILGLGAAPLAVILTATLWLGSWLRDVDRRLARLAGLLDSAFKGATVFRAASEPAAAD